MSLSISIIIPTLNEAESIGGLLQYLKTIEPKAELIVCDGGSSDSTLKEAAPFARVINAPRGRGAQMNAGAKTASGDIFWFIHADCEPHPYSVSVIKKSLNDSCVAGGAFEYNLNNDGLRFRIVESVSNFKNRLFRLVYGDMGIFIRREIFFKMGGYKEIPIMEDMDFSRRMKKFGKIVILPLRMDTSARRWVEEGWLKCVARSWVLQSLWSFGVSPLILARWYKFK